MYELDRIVAIVKPTETLLNWINSLPLEDKSEAKISLELIQEDCTALLIPPFETPEEADEYIESIHENIFENELMGWYIDESSWPADRNFELFNKFFTIEYHSMVFDLADEELQNEEGENEPEVSVH